MRADMFKVIVERPRRGGFGGMKGRRGEKFKQAIRRAAWDADAYDEPSNWESMTPSGWYDRKELNENLKPLWRFLDSRVGCLWSEVYSEIRENLSPKNAVQMHVVQHLDMHVILDTYLGEDGKVYENAQFWGRGRHPRCLSDVEDFFPSHYVHPVTHRLCRTNTKSRHPGKEPPTKFQVSDLCQFRFIDGAWFVVELAKIPKEEGVTFKNHYGTWFIQREKAYDLGPLEEPRSFEAVGDFLFPNGLRDYHRVSEYGFNNVRAVSMRAIGKREIRKLHKLLRQEEAV